MKKLFKILLCLAAIFLVMFLIFIGLLCWFFASMLDKKPFDVPFRVPDMQASSSAMKKLNIAEKINSMMLDGTAGTGENLETIVLDEKEVNAILVYGMTMDMAAKQDLDRDLKDVMFNDGAFTVMISKKIWISNPFGQYLNIKVVFVPGIQNRHFYVVPRSITVGSLGLPESFAQDRISNELSVVEQTDTGQAVLGIISELKLEKGRLTIIYSPNKLISYINENSMGASGLLGGGLGGMSLPPQDE